MAFKLILRKMMLESLQKKSECSQEKMADAKTGLGNGAGRANTAATGRRH